MTDEDKILTVDFSLEKVDIENNKVYIVSKSLTNDFEPDYVLEMLAKASKNKHYIWRHRHPIEPKHTLNHIYGEVENSWTENGALFSKTLLHDHTKDHLAYIELLKEREKINDSMGLSMRYRKYFDKNGVVVHTDVFEQSGTPFPKCEECGNIDMSVEVMNENNDNKKCPIEKGDEKKMSVEEIKILEESKKKIEDLEALLNSKTEAFEVLQGKVETLESEKKTKEAKLKEAEKVGRTLQDSVNELEATVTYLLKKPLVDKILELNTNLPKELVEFYKIQKEEFLEKEIDRLEKELETKPIVKSQEQSADEALEEETDKNFIKIGDKVIAKDKIFEYVTQDLNLEKVKE